MSRHAWYTVALRDGDGQPITFYSGVGGMNEVRELIRDCEQTWSHYESRHYIVTNEDTYEIVMDVRKGKRVAA
jgi:hypothetical protein